MRTVVINTSKAEQNMRFDILFQMPFGADRLFWINEELQNLGGCVKTIADRVLKDAHFVNREMNVIVIVDKLAFPYGRYEAISEMYNKLLRLYVRSTLLQPLAKISLQPKESCLVTVEYATNPDLPIDFFEKMYDNADEQARAKEEARRKKAEKQYDENGEALPDRHTYDDDRPPYSDKTAGDGNIDQLQKQILMKLFGWQTGMHGDELKWDVVIDVAQGTIINFETVFPDIVKTCRLSGDRDLLDLTIKNLIEALVKAEGEKNPVHYEIKCPFDSERDISFAYFQSLVHVYNCIEQGTLNVPAVNISEEKLKTLFEQAYAKYNYYADENHIPLTLEKLEGPRDAEVLEKFADLTITLPEDASVTDPLIRRAFSPEPLRDAADERLTKGSLDERFTNCAKAIAEDYAREHIEAQNTEVLMICMNQYLAWRDEKTAEGLKAALDEANKRKDDDPALKQDGIADITGRFEILEKKYEEMRKEDIENIVSVANEPADYENVCHRTNVLCTEYDHLCKQAKRYKLAMFGGAACVAVLFLAYLIYEGVSGWKGLARLPLYLGTLAAFAAAYLCAMGWYIHKIRAKKTDLFIQLKELKELGEKRRLESLVRLKNYYETVMTRAETHSLWWVVVQERYRRNFRLGTLKSDHVKLFGDLRKATLGFATKMKVYIDRNAAVKEKWTDFDVEKSYYDDPNVKYYAFFEIPEKKEDPQRKEAR